MQGIFGISRVTSKGQATIPAELRKDLGVYDGGKVVFFKKGNDICIANSSMVALREIQKAFEGEAEKVGWKDEKDVIEYIAKMRKERATKEKNESND